MKTKIILPTFFLMVLSLSVFVSAQTCTDSDNGKDYYTKAYVKNPNEGINEPVYDICIAEARSDNKLKEYYCLEGAIADEEYICPRGCDDGACVGDDVSTCIDTDGGINKYEKSKMEQCLGQYLLEYYCEGDEYIKKEIKCNCVEGVCWDSSTCIDSENPSSIPGWYQDEYVKGTIKITYKNNEGGIKEGIIVDECAEEGNLVDYSCSPADEELTFIGVGFGNQIKCEYGCFDGRCLKESKQINQTANCIDYDGGKNYYIKGETIFGKENVRGEDYCHDEEKLLEGYCDYGDGPYANILIYRNINVVCEFGCENGACIGKAENIDVEEEPVEVPETDSVNNIVYVCPSCLEQDMCYPLGYRKDGTFCSLSQDFEEQREAEESCENNFECSSNLCIDNQCVDSGLFSKIIRWFQKLLG